MIHIGVLGAARITPAAIVQPARTVEGVNVRAVAARDHRRALAFAQRYDITDALDDYQQLVTAPDIDLVYNALPVSLHSYWSIRALEAGKHVLCEKPLAMHAGEAQAMVAVAKRNGVRLIEAFHYRYHPLFGTFLSWLAAGRIGTVREMHAHFNTAIADNGDIRRRVDTGGGAMMDLGCYPLSWALQVFAGPATHIEATASVDRNGVDETMAARLLFGDGATAKISTSMAAGEPFSAALAVSGERGTIHFANPLSPHDGGALALTSDGGNLRAVGDRRPTYYHQLRAVATAVASNTPVPTEGPAILRQQAALDGVYAAAGLAHLRRSNAVGG